MWIDLFTTAQIIMCKMGGSLRLGWKGCEKMSQPVSRRYLNICLEGLMKLRPWTEPH
jgi:hypothetical protein